MRRIAAGLLILIILLSGLAVYAASGGESLVTQSYLEGTYLPDVLEQAEGRVEEKTQSVYQSVLAELDGLHSSYLGGGDSASALTDYRFKAGDVISISSGSGLLLLAGSGTISYSGGGVVDVTAGQVVASGSSPAVRHRLLAAENTTAQLTITSDTAVVSLEGRYTVSSGSGVDYNALADALKAMGLFQGTGTTYGSGYDLELAPTRVVGLVMFLRLIGEEQAALSSTAANPFSDTPAWCDRYVAYAYAQGYTQGTGTGADGKLTFGPDNPLSAEEYVTFLLRALGYTDSGAAPDFVWSSALSSAVEWGVLTPAEQAMLTSSPFLRAQVVYLSYFTLSAALKDGSGVLLDRTAASSGVSRSGLQAVMSSVTVQRLQ